MDRIENLSTPKSQPTRQFFFPYSHTMKAYLFGNFEEQLAFDNLTDDEVIEVLNDINSSLGNSTKASFSNVDIKDESSDQAVEPAPDESSVDNANEISTVMSSATTVFKGSRY
jgi:hypothetical protein